MTKQPNAPAIAVDEMQIITASSNKVVTLLRQGEARPRFKVIPPSTDLDDLAKCITEACRAAESHVAYATCRAIEAGRMLSIAKTAVGHGQWLGWLEGRCRMSTRTAQAYMQLSRRYAKLPRADAQRVAHLPLREALAAVTAAHARPNISRQLEIGPSDELDAICAAFDEISWILGGATRHASERHPPTPQRVAQLRRILSGALECLGCLERFYHQKAANPDEPADFDFPRDRHHLNFLAPFTHTFICVIEPTGETLFDATYAIFHTGGTYHLRECKTLEASNKETISRWLTEVGCPAGSKWFRRRRGQAPISRMDPKAREEVLSGLRRGNQLPGVSTCRSGALKRLLETIKEFRSED